MRLLRLLVAALALVGFSSLARQAGAQSVTVGARYEWSNDRDNRELTEINRADCLANAEITFSTDAVGPGALEVWAGSGCGSKTNRNENSQCVPVAKPDISAKTVVVRVQDMLQATANTALGPDTGMADVCDVTSNMYGGIERHLFFMVRDVGQDNDVSGAALKDIKFLYDITAPPPPNSVTAGPGETSLVVKFDGPDASDLQRYRFYCSEIGEPPAPGEGGAGNTDSEPQSADATCTSSVLVPGRAPPAEGFIDCGEEKSAQADGGTASPLANGTRYAVAVASVDAYENVGELSSLACATPQEVTGFFEAYRAAGGQGGGGFCNFGPARRGTLALAAMLLCGVAMLLRRRS